MRIISTLLMLLSAPALAQIPISLLPSASTPLTGNELTIVVQNNVTSKSTVSAFAPVIFSTAANSVLGNATASTAAPTSLGVPSCSTAGSALKWTTSSGFSCNTAIDAATLLTATWASPAAIGTGTPAAGTFTALNATGAFTASPSNANDVLSPTGTGTVTINPSTAGSINNMSIGGTTGGAGKFTTLEATGTATFDAAVAMSPATGLVSIGPTTSGSIDNMTVGASTPLAGTFAALKTTGTTFTFQSAGVTGTLAWAPSSTGKIITLPNGTTDFTATGGTNQFLKQNSSGAAITVTTIACADLSNAGTACTAATGTSGGTLPFLNGTNTWSGAQTFNSTDLKIGGAGAGVLTLTYANSASSNTITLPAGTTDFSATGGTSQVIKQTSSGAALTVARLACADLSDAGAGCSGASPTSWPPAPTAASNGATSAAANTLYCVDTTSGTATLTLPGSPSNGDKVGYMDCKGTFATNNLTVARNGNKIMNLTQDMTVNLNNQGGTLIYYTANTSWNFVQ